MAPMVAPPPMPRPVMGGMGLSEYRSLGEKEWRFRRRRMNQLYQPPKMAAARTRTPTPAPIPAFAPVERPEEPLLTLPSDATSVGATPGVVVKVAGSRIVVAGWVAMIKEVTVV